MKFAPVGPLRAWISLLRINRPVGYWLLLWPTLWGLLAASHGQPSLKNLIIFTAGVLLMRSAGCVINDFADRKLDPHVERTKQRPLAAGAIAPGAALLGFTVMLLLALLLVMQTSQLVVALAVVGALLAAIYPFLKRYTHFPQVWLGMAFGWGAVMAWAAETGSVTNSYIPWLLFVANIFWALSYDSAYALGDRTDDLKVGVKSTAIWFTRQFGEHVVKVIVLLSVIVLMLLAVVTQSFGLAVWLGWVFAAAWQLLLCARLLMDGEGWGFNYFLMSHWTGLFFTLGFVIEGLR